MSYRSSRRLLCALPLLFWLLALAGCGWRGTINGKVTHKGKPVVWGSVSVIASDQIQYSGEITPDGTYSIASVPAGPVKIGVTSPNPNSDTRGGKHPSVARGVSGRPKPPTGAWFNIPEKYADPLRSGLSGTVNSMTRIDLDLE